MKLKNCSIIIMLLMVHSLMADSNNVNHSFHGFYVGINSGVSASVNQMILNDPNDTDSPIHFTNGAVDGVVGAHIGYVIPYRQYLFIPELFVRYAPNTTRMISDKTEFFNYLQNHYISGLNVKFGRSFKSNATYGLLAGIENSPFTFNITNKPGNPTNKYHKTKWAWTVGVFSEMKVLNKLGITLTITYANFGDIKHFQDGITTDVKPVKVSGLVGINYYFS